MGRDELCHALLDEEHLLGLDLDITRSSADAAERLVHHDAGVGSRVALARRTCAQEELAHRRRKAHRNGRHVIRDELDRVVDDHAGRDRAARGVDVEGDVRLGILGSEHLQLLGDAVGVFVAYFALEPDDALAEQSLIEHVAEPCHAC